MSITLVRKSQIRPLNITRSDINTTTSGSALITKIIAGTGLTLSSSTGVNPGTGDVTVALSIATASTLGGVKIGSGLSVAVDGTISVNSVAATWGSITGLLSNQTDLQAALNAKYNNPTGTSSQYIDGTGAYQTFPSALATGFVRHEVKAGVAINKGQAVYVITSDGTNMIVGLASNASEATSSKTMGLLDRTVSINGFANVVTEGLLAGLNTVGANAGDPVWLGTGGNLIFGLVNKPYAPKHLVFIGIVTRVNANNGEIFVKVQNGFELDELHDVDLKTTLPLNGHLLGYNGTLWVNKTIAGWLGYTPQDAATAITTSNIGSQSVNYANSAGSATVAGYVNNQSGQLFSYDNRVIAPADTTEGYLQFGFTSWRNDGGSPYADYLHMRSYTDSSGGTDNLIMFLKSGIGMRIWQQTWGSNSPYAEYVDVWTTGNFTQTNVNNWNSAYSWGNHSSQGYATQTYVNTAIANLVDAAPPLLDTLNELAAALGDDPNFATTVANNIAGKVSKSGDTMTGNLNWAQTDRGLTWGMNTDGAYIKFFNAGDGDSDSRLEYATSDNGDEYHRWVIAGTERMNLRTEGLNVNGVIYSSGYGNSTEWYAAYTWGNHAGLYASISHTHTFASITSKPTTIAGYGITNAYTDTQIQNFFNGANAITGYNKSNWDTAYSWGNHASAGYRVNSINNTAYVYATSYRTVNYDFTLDPRLSIDSMSIKLWDNYFNNSGLGSDYGSLLDIYGRGGHVHSQFYMDASNTLYYRSSPYARGGHVHSQFYMDADNSLHYRSAGYAGGWRPWQQIWTSGTLTNLNQLVNGPGYITGYTETDTLSSVTGRGASTNTASIFRGGLYAQKAQVEGNYTTAALWTESYDNTTTGIAFHISGNYGGFLEMRTDRVLYWANNTIWHSGNLTNLSQLANGPGYLTSLPSHNHDDRYYTETEVDNLLAGKANVSHNHTSLSGVTSISFAAQSTDAASISTTIDGTSTFFDFNLTDDNNNDWWRWRFTPSGSTIYDAMTLKPLSNGNADLTISGSVFADNLAISNWNSAFSWGNHANAGYLTSAYLSGYLPLSGGTLSGPLYTTSELAFRDGAGSFSNIIRSAAYPSEGYPDGSNYWLEYRAKGGHHFILNTDGGVGGGLAPMDDFIVWQGDIDGDRLLELSNVGDLTIRGTFTEQSSLRYKENIINLESITEKVDKLRPVRYNKIGNTNTEIGLIAEEVAEVFPEFVNYNAKGQVESLNYTRLSVVLLQTVKELSDKINKLETK